MNLNALDSKLLLGWPFAPTEGQVEAVEALGAFLVMGNLRAVLLVSGFAGTGKTTWLRTVAAHLPSLGFRTVLLAPTGRAAKVIAERTGRRAFTIHRIIYRAVPRANGGVSFALRENPLDRAVFFVDEASMLSDKSSEGWMGTSLLEDLLQFVRSGNRCQLVLLGDTAQLPPVGEDASPALDPSVLSGRHDLEVRAVRLTEVVRQAQESTILANATQLRSALEARRVRFPKLQVGPDFLRLEDSNSVLDALNVSF